MQRHLLQWRDNATIQSSHATNYINLFNIFTYYTEMSTIYINYSVKKKKTRIYMTGRKKLSMSSMTVSN